MPDQMRLASILPHSKAGSRSAASAYGTRRLRGPRRRTAGINARSTPGRVGAGLIMVSSFLQPRLQAASISGRCHRRHRLGAVGVGNLHRQVSTARCEIMLQMSLQRDRRGRYRCL